MILMRVSGKPTSSAKLFLFMSCCGVVSIHSKKGNYWMQSWTTLWQSATQLYAKLNRRNSGTPVITFGAIIAAFPAVYTYILEAAVDMGHCHPRRRGQKRNVHNVARVVGLIKDIKLADLDPLPAIPIIGRPIARTSWPKRFTVPGTGTKRGHRINISCWEKRRECGYSCLDSVYFQRNNTITAVSLQKVDNLSRLCCVYISAKKG